MKFPSVAVIIIGGGELEKELRGLVEKNDLNETVYFAGFVDQASLYLKAFDVFTLTSLKEGLPYAIFESAYANVPVIATAVGGIPELIEDMKSGILIQSKKPAEIASSIDFMLANKSTAKEYALALHERMETHFSIATMFEKTFALYKQQ
jgi:glycosyltransferase involved in cell wall biosynthesis